MSDHTQKFYSAPLLWDRSICTAMSATQLVSPWRPLRQHCIVPLDIWTGPFAVIVFWQCVQGFHFLLGICCFVVMLFNCFIFCQSCTQQGVSQADFKMFALKSLLFLQARWHRSFFRSAGKGSKTPLRNLELCVQCISEGERHLSVGCVIRHGESQRPCWDLKFKIPLNTQASRNER